jgi:acyl-coenzyme A synthetase/AMP-(fatty) acid ligase
MGNVAKTAKIDLQVFGDSEMDVQEKAIPELFDMEITRPALIIFTSGTTGTYKIGLETHSNMSIPILILSL